MKNIIRYGNLILGCLIVAICINFLIIPNNLIPFGTEGISLLIYYLDGVSVGINLLIINVICLLISSLILKKEIVKVYLLPSILIPLFTIVTGPLTNYFSIEFPELMLVLLVSGFVMGTGYSIIYKQGFSVGVTYLIEETIGKITRFHSKFYSWIIDIILLIMTAIIYNYQLALYSLVVIFISKYMVTKARFGINDSKMFYIITSKEKEVKHFIIHDLKSELSVLDVKGGFSKKKNQILLTVISTGDYYKLKEGIKIIDDKAFIAITDTYDVVNRKSF